MCPLKYDTYHPSGDISKQMSKQSGSKYIIFRCTYKIE